MRMIEKIILIILVIIIAFVFIRYFGCKLYDIFLDGRSCNFFK